jgi:hypothetical protein
MTTLEGAMPVAPSALPKQGVRVSAPYMYLNKEWVNATSQLNFKKVSEIIKKHFEGVNVNNEKEMIKAVETLSTKKDLPSITDLMKEASSLNKAKSSAAKMLIAAQLFRSNKEKYKALIGADKDNVIKALILGGRWMVEKEEFLGEGPGIVATKVIMVLTAFVSIISIVTFPILGAIGAAYGIYRAWQKHQVEKWTEHPGLPQVVRKIADDTFKELRKIPYDWRKCVELDLTKKVSIWSDWHSELQWMYETPEFAERFTKEHLPRYTSIKDQLENHTGIATFLSETERKVDLERIDRTIETFKQLCSPSIERSTDTWKTLDKYLEALKNENTRLDTVLQIREQALGQTIQPDDADQVRKSAIEAVLKSPKTIKKLKLEGVKPSNINPPPEEFEKLLATQPLAVVFKTGQSLEEEINQKPPRFEIKILQQKLSITHNILLQKLQEQQKPRKAKKS